MNAESIGGSNGCATAVNTAMNKIAESVTAAGVDPDADLPVELTPCAPFDQTTSEAAELDLSTYQAALFGYWQGTVQYNNDDTDQRAAPCPSFATSVRRPRR